MPPERVAGHGFRDKLMPARGGGDPGAWRPDVVLLRAAGLDVVAAREGPRLIVKLEGTDTSFPPGWSL
jgi:hypothetical protein